MTKKNLILSVCSFTLLSLGAHTTPSNAADLQTYEDDAQIVASGMVSNLSDDEFVLKVKNQMINVDYREWDLLNFTDLRNHLKNGQKVVITGEVGDNWFAEDEIEADSIYFVSSNNYYSLDNSYPNYNLYDYDNDLGSESDNGANGDDMSMNKSENKDNKKSDNQNNMHDKITMQGKVISLMDEKFTMQTNAGPIKVNIKPLSPNREESRLHVEKGDNVLVYGRLDENLLKNDLLSADMVVKLNMKNK